MKQDKKIIAIFATGLKIKKANKAQLTDNKKCLFVTQKRL
jgi:hypothetical protein